MPDFPRNTVKALLIVCILMATLSAIANGQTKPVPSKMPDVLVLVLSGMGPVDMVSINYSTLVPDQTVKADIQALAKETAWLVGEEKVTTKAVGADGRNKTTSGTFNTLVTVNYREGLLPVAPFVTVLKRYRSIEVDYLVPQRFQFHGLKDFENEFVKLHLEQHGNSYLYRVRVKDNRFDRLVLPAHQPKPEPKQAGPGVGGRVMCIVILALLCGFAAYFGARAICRRRDAGG